VGESREFDKGQKRDFTKRQPLKRGKKKVRGARGREKSWGKSLELAPRKAFQKKGGGEPPGWGVDFVALTSGTLEKALMKNKADGWKNREKERSAVSTWRGESLPPKKRLSEGI